MSAPQHGGATSSTVSTGWNPLHESW